MKIAAKHKRRLDKVVAELAALDPVTRERDFSSLRQWISVPDKLYIDRKLTAYVMRHEA